MNGQMMEGRDLYLRYVFASFAGKPARTHVHHFRVWDAERFIAARAEEGNASLNPAELFEVQIATAADYRRGRK